MRKKNLIKGILAVGCLSLAMLAVKTTDVKADTIYVDSYGYTVEVDQHGNKEIIIKGTHYYAGSGSYAVSGNYIITMSGTELNSCEQIDKTQVGDTLDVP